MPKRTGNSSVNSSIRQQTKSNEEGLTQLLSVQQQSLGHVATIKTLMESAANLKDDEVLKIQQESLNVQKKQLGVLEDSENDRKKAQEDIQKLMDSMKTFKSPLERVREGVKGFAGKFSGDNIKKSFLESTNIMGINNKSIERQKFIGEQKALGSQDSSEQLRKKFEGAYSAKKESSKVEQKIETLRKATGGKFTDEELAKSSKGNADLFAKKSALAEEYSQFDIGAKLKGGAALVSPNASKIGQTPTAAFASANSSEEDQLENNKMVSEQTSLLAKIEENTRKDGQPAAAKPPEVAGSGLLDGITGFLAGSLMSSFKTLFNPMNILKALGKVFVIGAIIGSLFSGITDAFEEYKNSGSIGQALIAGLAGIVDFLTFGLFDKEKIKEVIGDFATWTSENLVKPFVKFITSIKDDFMAMISSIGIPEIKFKIPVINKEVSIGPFYPFKSDSGASTPTAAPPTTGDAVTGASKQNADAAAANSGAGGGNTAVVNAPVTTNNNTSQIIKSPIRNQESSMSKFVGSRYARA
jgi:hypothetical protein